MPYPQLRTRMILLLIVAFCALQSSTAFGEYSISREWLPSIVLPPGTDGTRRTVADPRVPLVVIQIDLDDQPAKVGCRLSLNVYIENRWSSPLTITTQQIIDFLTITDASGREIQPTRARPPYLDQTIVLKPQGWKGITVDCSHYDLAKAGVYCIRYKRPVGGGRHHIAGYVPTLLIEDKAEVERLAAQHWPDDPTSASCAVKLCLDFPGYQRSSNDFRPAPWCTVGEEDSEAIDQWFLSRKITVWAVGEIRAHAIAMFVAARLRSLSQGFAELPTDKPWHGLLDLASVTGESGRAEFIGEFAKAIGMSDLEHEFDMRSARRSPIWDRAALRAVESENNLLSVASWDHPGLATLMLRHLRTSTPRPSDSWLDDRLRSIIARSMDLELLAEAVAQLASRPTPQNQAAILALTTRPTAPPMARFNAATGLALGSFGLIHRPR